MACNLLMAIADASYTDLNSSAKMTGEGGNECRPTWDQLDAKLVELIAKRRGNSAEDAAGMAHGDVGDVGETQAPVGEVERCRRGRD
jgi:hypothetical protein